MSSEIGVSYTLFFTAEQAAKIEIFLKEFDFSPGKDGLKELVLDEAELSEDEKEDLEESKPLGSGIADAIKNNPEAARKLGEIGANLFNDIVKKKFKL